MITRRFSLFFSIASIFGLLLTQPVEAHHCANKCSRVLLPPTCIALCEAEHATGVKLPTLDEALERLARETTVETVGPALAVVLQESRNTSRSAAAGPIPPNIKARLQCHFPSSVLDKVRYKVGDNGWINVAGLSIVYGGARGVALIDTIVFKSHEDVQDVVLWAHEVYHVKQFTDWGVTDFAKKYVRDHHAVEQAAHDFEQIFIKSSASKTCAPWEKPVQKSTPKPRYIPPYRDPCPQFC